MQFCVSWYAEEQDAPAEFIEALADDLNTPLALAVTSKWVNQCLRDITEELSGTEISDEKNDEFIVTRGQLIGMMKMLGLGAADFVAVPVDITESDDEISQKLRLRDNARKAKLFAEADRIRQEVEETGIIVMDFPKTTLWMSDEPSLQRG
jgi:cysteinyl-tRNA synthetase